MWKSAGKARGATPFPANEIVDFRGKRREKYFIRAVFSSEKPEPALFSHILDKKSSVRPAFPKCKKRVFSLAWRFFRLIHIFHRSTNPGPVENQMKAAQGKKEKGKPLPAGFIHKKAPVFHKGGKPAKRRFSVYSCKSICSKRLADRRMESRTQAK